MTQTKGLRKQGQAPGIGVMLLLVIPFSAGCWNREEGSISLKAARVDRFQQPLAPSRDGVPKRPPPRQAGRP
jgi:hypothetical protein